MPAIIAPQVLLTLKEAEVLRWLRQGKCIDEIAQILGRSEHTEANKEANKETKGPGSNYA